MTTVAGIVEKQAAQAEVEHWWCEETATAAVGDCCRGVTEKQKMKAVVNPHLADRGSSGGEGGRRAAAVLLEVLDHHLIRRRRRE